MLTSAPETTTQHRALYTDLSLLTANEPMTGAINEVFNFLTAYVEQPHYDGLLVAPIDLADRPWHSSREKPSMRAMAGRRESSPR